MSTLLRAYPGLSFALLGLDSTTEDKAVSSAKIQTKGAEPTMYAPAYCGTAWWWVCCLGFGRLTPCCHIPWNMVRSDINSPKLYSYHSVGDGAHPVVERVCKSLHV